MIHYGNICLKFCRVYFKQVLYLLYLSSLFYLVMDVKHQYVTSINFLFHSMSFF